MIRQALRLVVMALLGIQLGACGKPETAARPQASIITERDVPVVMRDGVVLMADIYRPDTTDRVPVLVYRTPYGKHDAAVDYQFHQRAAERGYAVVLQDVRGRYTSGGNFDPYRNEGRDGFDTIEWAAGQQWSNGDVGTWGLSYPGAVQWLAAKESPPHLKAMAPAMTFSSPHNFFYMNGVFDLSWLPWIYFNIAPDARARLGMDGDTSADELAAAWGKEGEDIRSFLPLAALPVLREEAPYYFEWLAHPPNDPWWDWAEIRGNYHRTDAAVFNISGWYDEAYGPEGAVSNHNGVSAARRPGESRSHLVLGPWQHGVGSMAKVRLGELDFGPDSAINYDDELLRFFDYYLLGKDNGLESEAAVRYFMMGANEWRRSDNWPPRDAGTLTLCLQHEEGANVLDACIADAGQGSTSFVADPAKPVVDPYDALEAHDYQLLAERSDVLVFETTPLEDAISIAGSATASMYVSCDCVDFDLWVRLLDVYPDGRAINLMSPGADVQRMSDRAHAGETALLAPGDVYQVDIGRLLTANRFDAGHRIRIQVSASFAPHLSRNLQTGQSEIVSSDSKPATITVHHGPQFPSALILPVVSRSHGD